MSEKIKISVVIGDEKPNAEENEKNSRTFLLTQDSVVTLMPVLLQNHLMKGSFCGGRGDCGRCVVQFLEGAPLPTGLERARLTPEELRQGYRLACVTRPRADCVVRIIDSGDVETPIVTEMNLPSENIDLNGQEKNLSENQEAGVTESQKNQKENEIKNKRYMIAVDLGTTTIAMQLRDMETGEAADTYCERNPQRIYGTDVLARIEASCNGNREELQKLICESFGRGLRQFAAYLRGRQNAEKDEEREAGNQAKKAAQIVCMCIAGNTTMEHLLMGYDVQSLGRAPFVPVETGLQRISASCLFHEVRNPQGDEDGFLSGNGDFPVYLAPCISAFVGGDIVAGLYALHMLPDLSLGENTENDEPKTASDMEREVKHGTTLLIDLGTNGEMAITDGRRMVVTATAAGPAFEGSGELIGTDRIARTAELLRRGILDETGFLTEDGCYFKQEDIRSLQMAKAAVRAGAEILWEEMGRPEIDRIYLAGGFGYYLDVEAAVNIGLLPAYMRGRVQAVGNTSLAGAYALGRDLCEKKIEKEILEEKLSGVESINLAQKENFEKLYLKYMNLEEN